MTITEARAIRMAAGFSQSQLAVELGLHPITLNRWETGHRRPAVAARARWSRLLRRLQSEAAA